MYNRAYEGHSTQVKGKWLIGKDHNRCIKMVGDFSIEEKENFDSQFINVQINEPMPCHC